MHLHIELPERSTVLASNRRRWKEVLSDPVLAEHGYRIETNAFGQIVMTPPASGPHSSRQSEIAFRLRSMRGGRALVECPISTLDGVKAADVGWYSDARYHGVRGQIVFETAAEICVEVMSPANSEAEMETKRRLYFDAGAIECWICDLQGQMTYYNDQANKQPQTQSQLCPDFPTIIED